MPLLLSAVAAVVAADVTRAVRVVVMIAARLGIIAERAVEQRLHRRVRAAAHASVKPDAGLLERRLRTAANAAAAGAGALFLAQNAFETDALQTNIVPIVNIVLLGVGTVGMYLVGRARGKI